MESTPGRPSTRWHTKQVRGRAVRLVFEICNALGTAEGTVIRITDGLRYGTESLRRSGVQAEVDVRDVSDWKCNLAVEDALRTRFIERWV